MFPFLQKHIRPTSKSADFSILGKREEKGEGKNYTRRGKTALLKRKKNQMPDLPSAQEGKANRHLKTQIQGKREKGITGLVR